MNRSFPVPALWSAALFLLAALPGRADDQIRTYTVPKEIPPPIVSTPPTPPSSGDSSANMAAGQVPAGDPSASIEFTTPDGWKQLPPNGVRVVSLAIEGANGKKADVAVTHFPGSVGSELSNVNRWRHELNLDPVTEAGLSSQPVTVDSDVGKLYDLSSPTAQTVVADIPHNGESWFFKLRGDKEIVASARPAFLEFLKSVKFAQKETALASNAGAPPLPPPASDPSNPTQSNLIQPNLPPTWHERPPGDMILRAYSVGDASAPATVTVSSFAGVMGGLLANVNRWRRQLQLDEISADSLPSVAHPVTAHGDSATMVDFAGTDGQTAKPARMVAVMVPRGDQTWFYKLLGDPATVAREKDVFLQYVQSAPDK